jgi:predicted RNA binding protein YcfA (HicA-like mRNA interferase family)
MKAVDRIALHTSRLWQARLPILSGRSVVKALALIGYSQVRQRGSPIRLTCIGRKSITVPDHRVIGRGLLKKILRDADLSVEDFVRLL